MTGRRCPSRYWRDSSPRSGRRCRAATSCNARWLLGSPAIELDLAGKQVRLGDGGMVEYDRLLIATGARARPWPNEAEAALDGMFALRTRDDAAGLRRRLAGRPRRVLVIGAGFTGSEVASACRDQDLPVTVAERGAVPLRGALGEVIGAIAAGIQREHGVDLRCGVTVTGMEGDGDGRLRRAHLSDGATIDADVAVVALGAIRNVEWLLGSGLAVGPWGVACDAGCRAFDANGLVTDDVFVAGDVARSPHPVYDYQFLAVEHWGNAVAQARVAAHNMINAAADRWPYVPNPVFWSVQFGTNIKSVGVPTFADQVVIAQGSVADAPVRRRLRLPGPGDRRGRLRPGQVAGVLPEDDRRGRAVPAPVPRGRRARRLGSTAGRPARSQDQRAVRRDRHGDRARPERAPRGARVRPPAIRALTGDIAMAEASIFDQILDPANRANPYPLYAELRKVPVTRQADGMYVVSTYDEIVALLHDRRVSSDPRSHPGLGEGGAASLAGESGLPMAFINRDPPEHDRLRELAMRPFGPPRHSGADRGHALQADRDRQRAHRQDGRQEPRRHRRGLLLSAAGDGHLRAARRPA